MRHAITLEEYDYSRLSFRCRHICDRDYHKQTDDIRGLMIDQKFANPFARMDMFWIEVTCDDVDLGPVCIETKLYSDKFQVSQNHCKVSDDRLFKLASEWFVLQSEYQQQLANLRDIEAFINAHGGLVSWISQCKQAASEHNELKQTTVAQYADRFAVAMARPQSKDHIIQNRIRGVRLLQSPMAR